MFSFISRYSFHTGFSSGSTNTDRAGVTSRCGLKLALSVSCVSDIHHTDSPALWPTLRVLLHVSSAMTVRSVKLCGEAR